MRFAPKPETSALRDMVSSVAAQTDLSDVTTSGGVYGMLRAIASELGESNISIGALIDLFGVQTAGGTDLDEVAKTIVPGLLRRGRARQSVGRVQFTRRVPGGASTEFVPAGTVVLSDGGFTAVSTAVATVVGLDTVTDEVSAVASAAGESGNIEVGQIRAISSAVGTFVSATNTTPFTGGRTIESDDQFRTRIFDYVATLSRATPEGLRGNVLGVLDEASGKQVLFASIVEWDSPDRGNVVIYIDDGAGTARELGPAVLGEVVVAAAVGGEEFAYLDRGPIVDIADGGSIVITSSLRGTLYPGGTVGQFDFYFLNPASRLIFFEPPLVVGEQITASYSFYVNLIASAQRVVDGDPLAVEDFPGCRAAGVIVRVRSATVTPLSIAMLLTIDEAGGFNRDDLRAEADDETLRYVNGLNIGEQFVLNELVQRIMEIRGVLDVAISFPTANMSAAVHEVFRNTTNDVDVD